MYSTSTAAGIDSDDITNWNAAHGWGNHATAGYVETEADPQFAASVAAGIETNDLINWDAAVSWGNHATAGYIKASDLSGEVDVNGYVTVGDPPVPESLEGTRYQIHEGFGGVEFDTLCGTGGWQMPAENRPPANYLLYDNDGSRGVSYATLPWVWIPSGTTDIEFEAILRTPNSGLEATYDGVWAEHTTDGATWNLLDDFAQGQYYAGTVAASDDACTRDRNLTGVAWSGVSGTNFPASNAFNLPASTAGGWVRIRFVGTEDESVGTGDLRVVGVGISGVHPATSGFANGNLYTENNVYAGSNRLMGDVAEYVPSSELSNPGDLLAVDPLRGLHVRPARQGDTTILGVHSTDPTLLVNRPGQGVPLALVGRVPVNVTTAAGPIRAGDRLALSAQPGIAELGVQPGTATIAVALEDLPADRAEGQVMALLQPGAVPGRVAATHGQSHWPEGATRHVVHDDQLAPDAGVFLTFRGPSPANWWLEEVRDGSAVLRSSEGPNDDVRFDYHVTAPTPTERDVTALPSASQESPLRNQFPPEEPPDRTRTAWMQGIR